jgi:ribonucleotide reductase alpha subunit
MTKSIAAFHDVIKKSNSKGQDYYWLSNSGEKGLIPEHKIITNCFEYNQVVHHKDFNGMNNKFDNLEIMNRDEHNLLHSKNIIGDKNPYHRMTDEWKYNFSSHKGESNHKFKKNLTNDEIRNHALKLTNLLDRRFSNDEWISYAKENNLPQNFSDFRHKELGTILSLSKWAALKCNMEMIDVDTRLVRTYKNALENGYDAEIIDNEVLVNKICEECGEKFKINYFRREISFCSHKCSLNHLNKDDVIKQKRTNSVNEAYKLKSYSNKQKQIKIYSDLKFNLGREPYLLEWGKECKSNNIPSRLKTKYGFKTYAEVKEESEYFNHKVLSVEEDGFENVYNGTVDEFHNFFSGYFKEINRFGKDKYLNINQLQCGELPLCPYDSCRLLAINLYSYVVNPFTDKSYFDWDKFKQHVIYAERFMDDIVDLEAEKIQMILSKIESDPEPENIKRVEKETWHKIMSMTLKGRRTGLGITAEGDMLAALGLIYGTSEATDFSTEVHKNLTINAYKSSAIMAKERGPFSVYNYEKELNNPFIKRLKDLDTELDTMFKEWGRRNIALLTIAPTGCLTENTIINTDKGEISLGDIFLINGVDIENLKGVRNIWIEPVEDIYVFNVEGKKNKINKLFWNGLDETRIIKYSSNDIVESTLEHKFLIKINDNEAIWKKTSELKVGDKIIKLKNRKI